MQEFFDDVLNGTVVFHVQRQRAEMLSILADWMALQFFAIITTTVAGAEDANAFSGKDCFVCENLMQIAPHGTVIISAGLWPALLLPKLLILHIQDSKPFFDSIPCFRFFKQKVGLESGKVAAQFVFRFLRKNQLPPVVFCDMKGPHGDPAFEDQGGIH